MHNTSLRYTFQGFWGEKIEGRYLLDQDKIYESILAEYEAEPPKNFAGLTTACTVWAGDNGDMSDYCIKNKPAEAYEALESPPRHDGKVDKDLVYLWFDRSHPTALLHRLVCTLNPLTRFDAFLDGLARVIVHSHVLCITST